MDYGENITIMQSKFHESRMNNFYVHIINSVSMYWSWPLTFQPPNHSISTISLGHSLYRVWTLSFVFDAMDKQTERRTRTSFLPTPTDSVGVCKIMNMKIILTLGASESGFSSRALTLACYVITWASCRASAFAMATVTIVTKKACCNHTQIQCCKSRTLM